MLTLIGLVVVAVLSLGVFGALTEPSRSAAQALMPYTLFQGGRRRRRRAPRRARLLVLVLARRPRRVLLIGSPRRAGGAKRRAQPLAGDGDLEPLAGGGTAPSPLAVRLEQGGDPVRARFKRMPRSGCCSTSTRAACCGGATPTRVLPIASLTKMMTALVVADRLEPARRCRSRARRCATRARASACCRAASGSASRRCSTA